MTDLKVILCRTQIALTAFFVFVLLFTMANYKAYTASLFDYFYFFFTVMQVSNQRLWMPVLQQLSSVLNGYRETALLIHYTHFQQTTQQTNFLQGHSFTSSLQAPHTASIKQSPDIIYLCYSRHAPCRPLCLTEPGQMYLSAPNGWRFFIAFIDCHLPTSIHTVQVSTRHPTFIHCLCSFPHSAAGHHVLISTLRTLQSVLATVGENGLGTAKLT